MTNEAIRVKALEWREVGELHFALSPLGIYETQDAGGSGWWIVVDGKSVCFDDGLPPIFQTLEEAKAACQADFARRVGECVEVGDALKARCDKLKAERNQVIRELIEKAKEIGASIHSPEFVTTDRSTGEAVLYSADLADWLKAQMTEGE